MTSASLVIHRSELIAQIQQKQLFLPMVTIVMSMQAFLTLKSDRILASEIGGQNRSHCAFNSAVTMNLMKHYLDIGMEVYPC